MHHGRKHKAEIVFAERERIAVLYRDELGQIARKIIFEHYRSLLIDDDLHVRIAAYDSFETCRMVWLHMVHHKIVKASSAQRAFDVFKELLRNRLIHANL